MKQELHVNIYGRVQGVFYRAECRDEAQRLGLSGWAKNNNDGSVSVCAQGEEKDLLKLINWCEQGPRNADVDKIEKEWCTIKERMEEFEIR